jgi:hypothetical protein
MATLGKDFKKVHEEAEKTGKEPPEVPLSIRRYWLSTHCIHRR